MKGSAIVATLRDASSHGTDPSVAGRRRAAQGCFHPGILICRPGGSNCRRKRLIARIIRQLAANPPPFVSTAAHVPTNVPRTA